MIQHDEEYYCNEFEKIKKKTEQFWRNTKIDNLTYGFQIQPRTKWRKGLTEAKIRRFEKELGFDFPLIYKAYLKTMNGFDKKGINIYGNSGEKHTYRVISYSYPDDLVNIRDMIKWIYDSFKIDTRYIEDNKIPNIIPVFSHRFLIANNCNSNPVLSMHGDDVIIYSDDLVNYLYREFFKANSSESFDNICVNFWCE